jgi:hypothetical protein
MMIAPSGNVGIGTTTAAYPLDVSSSMRIKGAATTGLLLTGQEVYSQNGPLYLNYNSTSNTIINGAGGSVGIGTATPAASLTVVGEVQVGSSGAGCSASTAGAIRYASNSLNYCDGSSWQAVFGQTTIPNAFNFTDQTGVAVNTTISSNAVTLGGFAGSQTATCTGCTAIARNGVWGGTTVAGFTAGDTIAIRVTSSGSYATAVTAYATVAGRNSGTWSVTTASLTGPNAFSFTDVTNASIGITYTSNGVSLTGFTGPLTATCNTCTGIGRNGVWGVSPLTGFVAGDTITVRQTAPATAGGSVSSTTVTVGSTTSGAWSITTASACSAGIAVGQTCPDGTIFAGFTPDGNVPMYTTPCDAGQTWDGSACTGTRLTKTWNNGSNDWTDTGYTSAVTGLANTTGLAVLMDAGGPYVAAQYCDSLTAHGHSDWYLPARSELNLYSVNKTAIGGFDTSGSWYWSASESNSAYAWLQRFSDGSQPSPNKSYASYVRCARR